MTTMAEELTFRDIFRSFPATTCAITTIGSDGVPHGATCTAVCPVSPEPASLMICLDQESTTLHAIRANGTFVVNFLGSGAEGAAMALATKDPDKFERFRWTRSRRDNPIVAEGLSAYAECVVDDMIPSGDHVIVTARIELAYSGEALRPLLYYRRAFHSLEEVSPEGGAA
jgi:flavin reductase (DIM6/NTAB) family NADH-FMN oxidoreductase RutF